MPNEHEQDNGMNNKFVVGGYTPIPQNDVEEKKKTEANGNCNNVAVKAQPEEDEYELVVPDGGWGWFVLIAAVMVNILIPGTIKSFGVLFVEFLEVFEASPAAAAWIPALCYFLYSSLGPLSSILSVKYSYRTVTLIGGTFAAVGMMSSYFATSVGFLCVSYGILVGTGAGLSFPPTVYIVTSYFDRYKGIANGLCISGSAMGSIILPPILGYLLRIYGYRGAVLIMGAVTLNVWAGALLYDPVEKHMIKRKINHNNVPTEPEKSVEKSEDSTVAVPSTIPSTISKTTPSSKTNDNNNAGVVANSGLPKSASSVALQNYKNHAMQWRTHKVSMTGSGREIASQMHSTPILYNDGKHRNSFRGRAGNNNTSNIKSLNYVATPFHGSTLSIIPAEETKNLTLNAISKTFRKTPDKESNTNKFFDVSLLKDPLYLVILISNSTNAVSYTNFVILLPAYAIGLDFSKDAASLLLSIVSILDLAGRIGGSSLSDLNLIPKHWYFVGGLFLSGVALTILPFATDYVMVAFYCGVFGLASGVYVGITTVIMADMLGQEKLTSSYGISLFVNGIIQLVGPPICGIIFERIGSYGPIFMILGLILSAGALLWGFVPFIKSRSLVPTKDNNC